MQSQIHVILVFNRVYKVGGARNSTFRLVATVVKTHCSYSTRMLGVATGRTMMWRLQQRAGRPVEMSLFLVYSCTPRGKRSSVDMVIVNAEHAYSSVPSAYAYTKRMRTCLQYSHARARAFKVDHTRAHTNNLLCSKINVSIIFLSALQSF